MKRTYPTLLPIFGCLLLPGLAFSQSGQSPAGHVPCVEITGRTANFAPSLGESASISVKITPPPPSGGYPGYYFQCEIVRVPQNCSTQRICWVDTIPGTPDVDQDRDVDFHTLTMVWDGVACNSPGQVVGIGTFQGIYAGTSRRFPPIVVGECVPPPFCTVVARIRRNSDNAIVCEDLKHICVKQVVVVDFTAAESVMREELLRNDNEEILPALNDLQYLVLRQKILIEMAQDYGGTVNIEFTENGNASQPCSYLRYELGSGSEKWGEAPLDFWNINTKDEASGFVNNIRSSIRSHFTAYNDQIPLSWSEHSRAYSYSGTHEIGHLLGLTAANQVLNGNADGHNKPSSPNPPMYFMNDGGFSSLLQRIGRNTSWSFRGINNAYLRWVLPKNIGDDDELCN